jgi:predicted double-glycine peptidase
MSRWVTFSFLFVCALLCVQCSDVNPEFPAATLQAYSAGPSIKRGFEPPNSTKINGLVPLAGQSTNYSCGAAAMQSVLAYYGHVYAEEFLIKELGSTEKEGTDHLRMAAFANQLGIKAHIKSNVTLSELKATLDRDQIAIVECQAHEERPGKDYATMWDAGHYMVAIGIDENHIYFMDPSLGGYRGYLTHAEFLVRWHDLNYKNEKLYQTVLFFDAKPNPQPLPTVWSKIP